MTTLASGMLCTHLVNIHDIICFLQSRDNSGAQQPRLCIVAVRQPRWRSKSVPRRRRPTSQGVAKHGTHPLSSALERSPYTGRPPPGPASVLNAGRAPASPRDKPAPSFHPTASNSPTPPATHSIRKHANAGAPFLQHDMCRQDKQEGKLVDGGFDEPSLQEGEFAPPITWHTNIEQVVPEKVWTVRGATTIDRKIKFPATCTLVRDDATGDLVMFNSLRFDDQMNDRIFDLVPEGKSLHIVRLGSYHGTYTNCCFSAGCCILPLLLPKPPLLSPTLLRNPTLTSDPSFRLCSFFSQQASTIRTGA